MIDYALNIIGSEWIIIIFVALILLFGTNKLPEAGKKIGKMVGEYNKAKTEMQSQNLGLKVYVRFYQMSIVTIHQLGLTVSIQVLFKQTCEKKPTL